ncbi:MAG TPA: ComEC/Rec2 family competence protein [Opitutaceae bacterium]|nr:ComEC/Rec2 family competence protein [Opitutaceae bacterium]
MVSNPLHLQSRCLGHRAPLLWLLLPFLAGISLGRLVDASPAAVWLLAGALIAALAAISLAKRNPLAWAAALGAAMLFAGLADYALHARRLPGWDALPPREARLSLRVDRVFAAVNPKRTSGLAVIVSADAPLEELAGQRVYFSLARPAGAKALVRSAVVSAAGLIQAVPRHPAADSFDDYLANTGLGFKFTRGHVLAEEKPARAYFRFCARAQEKFSAILGAGLADKRPELAGILRAMMLSQKHELNSGRKELFMQSGTMHFFAISGLHIGVIASVLQALLALLRLPRWARFVIGTALLWLYVDITGASPSAERALVMVIFMQAALVLRWPGNPLAALVTSAFVVLLAHPMQLFTASFQMSYCVVATLLLLGLPLGERLRDRWKLFPHLPKVSLTWRQRLAMTALDHILATFGLGVATALVAAVTGIAFFRLFTPGALAANLGLIPLASFAIFAGFISLLCGLAGFSSASVLFNHAAALILATIQGLIGTFVKVPGAYWPAEFRAEWWADVLLAALLAACLAGYAARWRRGMVLAPFALVALALIFVVKFG